MTYFKIIYEKKVSKIFSSIDQDLIESNEYHNAKGEVRGLYLTYNKQPIYFQLIKCQVNKNKVKFDVETHRFVIDSINSIVSNKVRRRYKPIDLEIKLDRIINSEPALYDLIISFTDLKLSADKLYYPKFILERFNRLYSNEFLFPIIKERMPRIKKQNQTYVQFLASSTAFEIRNEIYSLAEKNGQVKCKQLIKSAGDHNNVIKPLIELLDIKCLKKAIFASKMLTYFYQSLEEN